MNLDGIPQELKDNALWCLWKWEQREGKRAKVPYNPRTGRRGKPGNARTFAPYDVTAAAFEGGGYDGLGLGIFRGYAAVDIDHCIQDGALSDLAQDVIQTLDSYTEYSPSGKGIRILLKTEGVAYDKARYYIKHPRSGLEVYVTGATNRYVTVTGNVLLDKPIEDRSAELAAVLEAYMQRPARTNPRGRVEPGADTAENKAFLEQGLKKDKTLLDLWNGARPSGDESADDLALLNKLAYWCNADADLMLEAFISSPYYEQKDEGHKAKCDRWDYLPNTIQKAIGGLQSTAKQDHAAWSLQRAREAFLGDTWPHQTEKGKPLKHWENTKWLCAQMGIVFRYNEMAKDIETDHDPYKKLSLDSIITDLRGLCVKVGYNVTKTDMADHITRIAEDNTFNPVRDYLTRCLKRWDGKSRTRELFDLFVLDPDSDQDPEFCFTLFEKWLITCAKLPFNKGEDAAQGVLVLIGGQGIGKTRWGFRLLPNPTWGKFGRMIDLRDKDTLIQALQYWIVELGEYGRNLTAEKSDHYKAFVTECVDTFRVPYARSAEKHPRTTVFYASTDTDAFLKDDAGERRNWVIQLKEIKDNEIDLNQLWGEVAHRALVEKRPHWLTGEEIRKLNRQNEAYKVRSPEYEQLYDSFDWTAPREAWIFLTSSEVCRVLGIDIRRVRHVGRALGQMQALGVKRDRDTSRRKHFMPPFKDDWVMMNVKQHVKNYKLQALTGGLSNEHQYPSKENPQ